MNSELRNKMYDMEVTPPKEVWNFIDKELDEINRDNVLAQKLYNSDISPLPVTWDIIKKTLDGSEEVPSLKKSYHVYRYLTIAAISIGIMISLWLVFKQSPTKNEQTQTIGPVSRELTIQKADTNSENNPAELNTDSLTGTPNYKSLSPARYASLNPKQNTNSSRNKKDFETLIASSDLSETLVHAKADDPSQKPEFDDLSKVSADDQYMTMVNANGRLVKIPAQLAHLAPRFQDKPFEEDYYEILFGQSNFWKETFDRWRENLATNPSMNGDIFSSVIALLKSIED